MAETEGFEIAPMANQPSQNRMISGVLTSWMSSSIRSAGFDSWQKRGGVGAAQRWLAGFDSMTGSSRSICTKNRAASGPIA